MSAVATVGGGANIPLVTQQLSERLRAPVVTTPQSQLNVAAGAALVADRGLEADAPTGMAPTGSAADAPTGMAAAAWAAGAAGTGRVRVGLRRRGVGDVPRAGVVAGRIARRASRCRTPARTTPSTTARTDARPQVRVRARGRGL